MIYFTKYTKPDYIDKWFHIELCQKLDALERGEIKRLMVFMPPQHGKSELVSRRFPAFALGRDPNRIIVQASYGHTLSSRMNRDTQRIIDTEKYHDLFPNTTISQLDSSFQGLRFMRNQKEFEVRGYNGRYISVGVMGGITGNPADIGIIDDPIKDALEAYSITYRNRIWDWYVNVFLTRLHNDSVILLTMTRWHEDDLAGRILKNISEGRESEPWTLVVYPAVREDSKTPTDPRRIGESLWEERHDLNTLLSMQKTSPKTFASLYQQRPSPEEGNIFRKEWFHLFRMEQLRQKEDESGEMIIWSFVADTAYEDKERNDPSAFIAYTFYQNNLYIRDVSHVLLTMPELIRFAKDFVQRNGYSDQSILRIEPKASGKSLIQMLKAGTGLNVTEGFNPTTDKVARANLCVPFCESGRVFLLEGAGWLDMFLSEVLTFPNASHDDIVDCLTMSIKQAQSAGGEAIKFRVY